MGRLAALAVVVLVGCSPVRRRADGNLVRAISFEGNGGFFSGHNDYQLRRQMQQRDTKFGLLVWPLIYTVDPKTVDDDLLVRDAYRLEVWYAHHGWFDAQVVGWELRRLRQETERRAGVLDIHGVVNPGVQSTIRSLEIEGLPDEFRAIENAVLRKAPKVGDPYDLDALESARQDLATKLLNHARPYAAVAISSTAHPSEHAVDVVLVADAGIAGKVGEVTVSGQDAVPEKAIRQSADLERGAAYELDALRDAQRKLFEVGTFSIVNVEPDLSDPTRQDVPIGIAVTESKFRTFRLGGGIEYDSAVPTAQVEARIRHMNLFRQLVRADLGVSGGIAVDPTSGSGFFGGQPTWSVDLSLEYPRLFATRGSIDLSATVEQDVYGGLWPYRRPEIDLHFVYRATPEIQFRVGPHYESYEFLGEFSDAVRGAQERLFGIDSDQAFVYQLTTLDQYVTFDFRDDPTRTRRGHMTSVSLREAFRLSTAGYSFIKASAEHRRYIPLRAADQGSAFPWTLAIGAQATGIVPYGPTTQIPLPERAFLGGATSIRGFRPNQVGPYSTLCTYVQTPSVGGLFGGDGGTTTEQLVRYNLPSGGTWSGEVSGELRYDWAYGVTFALFADGGVLRNDLNALTTNDFRGSAGVGLRYDTIVGPVRFDLSFRPLYPEDYGPQRAGTDGYLQCRVPADKIPRVFDFFSNFPGLRDDKHPPFALVFFITFGEAL
ncbi:MAG: BamA/TamA family outer membrane protein [Myxococcota bacterium]